jgi:hypothetical protein
MPRDSQYARRLQQTSALTSLPAPVGGLNARDALASMPPTQAVILENFFPSSAGLVVRKGWFRYYDDIPDPTETILKWNGPDGSEKIFAAAGGDFINVSLGGVYDAGDIVATGFTNDRWQYVQLANLAGDFTVAVNGDDTPQYYDGSTWQNAIITADGGLYPDFDPTKLIHVAQMHRRLWFTEKDSTRVWYLPTDVVQGEVKLFDCGEVFPLGGYCQLCMSWSVDTGAGMDDQSIFLSSKGNVAVFSGFDPDDVTTFTLVGVYTTGATFSRRCAAPYGSDVIILCENGVVTLTSILSQSKMLMQPPLTDIIQHRLSDLVNAFNAEFGWDLFTSSRYNQLYLNIPDPEAKYQYVMNTILDAWCVFTGYNAYCWENFFEEPVFGGSTYVGRAWSGFVDDPMADITVTDTRITSSGDVRITSGGDIRITQDSSAAGSGMGTSIQTKCLQAFNYFGSPVQKNWSMARPVFLSDAEPATVVFFNTDFEIVENDLPLPPFQNTGLAFLWDAPDALWDSAVWAGQARSWKRWYGLNNIGFAGAIFLRTGSIHETIWLATDFQFIKGGTL